VLASVAEATRVWWGVGTSPQRPAGLVQLGARDGDWLYEAHQRVKFRESGRGLLADKVAVVSGVGTGLGRSISVTLADEGASVVLAARNAKRLDHVVAEIKGAGGSAIAVPTDVSRPEQCARLVKRAVDAFGRLDIVVNNGHHQGDFTMLEESNVGDWESIFAVNVYGPMRIIQAAIATMRAQGDGRIINVNSGAVISNKPTLGAYSASKAGLASITKTLALELGRSGIRVNGIYVSSMVGDNVVNWGTRMAEAEGITFDEWLARKSEAEFATGTMPLPDEVAGVVLFLASDMSRSVTGQMLSANNGQWVEGNQ
jgi:NAD(P)-dependent dehydrogenase (short-subunit alcohol dehydrogenase family)